MVIRSRDDKSPHFRDRTQNRERRGEEEQMIPDAKGEDGGTIKCRRWLNRGSVKLDKMGGKIKVAPSS